ncbi:MAG: hypothetical protein FWF77_02365, partial [Defluviitaleaceae bacterium]|nr:hypothetical protein [Defluviitaleaceae bacterium]
RRRRIPSKPGAVYRSKKARQARSGHRGHVSAATHSLEAGSSFLIHKKNESASDTRRLIFFTSGNCFRLRGNTPIPTCVFGAQCAPGALFFEKHHPRTRPTPRTCLKYK